MKELSPHNHQRIDALYKRNKKAFNDGLSATVMVTEDVQRKLDGKVALADPKEHMKLVNGYLDLVALGLRSNVSAIDMGLWIQGFFTLFDQRGVKI